MAIAATDGLQRLGDATHVAELLRVQERSAAAASFVEDREPEPETPASIWCVKVDLSYNGLVNAVFAVFTYEATAATGFLTTAWWRLVEIP